jgi:hypothetical protein
MTILRFYQKDDFKSFGYSKKNYQFRSEIFEFLSKLN